MLEVLRHTSYSQISSLVIVTLKPSYPLKNDLVAYKTNLSFAIITIGVIIMGRSILVALANLFRVQASSPKQMNFKLHDYSFIRLPVIDLTQKLEDQFSKQGMNYMEAH